MHKRSELSRTADKAMKISAMETTRFFEKRAASASTPAAQAAWDRAGSKAAIAGDNWTKPVRI